MKGGGGGSSSSSTGAPPLLRDPRVVRNLVSALSDERYPSFNRVPTRSAPLLPLAASFLFLHTRCPALSPQVRSEVNRPQPRLDRDTGKGFTTVVGRVRSDPINTVKVFVLSHNTVMGAAGSSILNAELAAVKGLLRHRA